MPIHADRIGLSVASLPNRTLHEAIEQGRAMGFRAVELLAFDGARHSIGTLSGFWFDRMSDVDRRRLADAVADFSCVSVHAPFLALQPFTHNPGIRDESLRQLRTAIEATAFLGGSVTVMHVNSRSYLTIRDYWQDAVSTLRGLADCAAEHGVRVGVETGYPNSVDDFCGLIEEAGHPNLGACVDVGHVVAYLPAELRGTTEGVARCNDLLMQIVSRLRNKVVSFHLHDVRASDFRNHRAAGRGIVDFPRLLKHLSAAWDGPLMFELEEPDVEAALMESRRHIVRALQPSET